MRFYSIALALLLFCRIEIKHSKTFDCMLFVCVCVCECMLCHRSSCVAFLRRIIFHGLFLLLPANPRLGKKIENAYHEFQKKQRVIPNQKQRMIDEMANGVYKCSSIVLPMLPIKNKTKKPRHFYVPHAYVLLPAWKCALRTLTSCLCQPYRIVHKRRMTARVI